MDDLDISLDDYSLSESSTVYDRDGNVLATLKGSENRIWVDYEDIPEDLEHALVAIEDKRFYDHKGVDWYRTVGAVFNMFLGMRDNFGGSTITQQLSRTSPARTRSPSSESWWRFSGRWSLRRSTTRTR